MRMCGFAGFLDMDGVTPEREAVVRRMAGMLMHRGPDGEGAWVDGAAGMALGFRRLAVLDLSPEGAQPMQSHDGRWVVAFDGEIYNHADIRRRLGEGIAWRGHSDTEVLLEAVARWGVERALALFDGMFALALWDRVERVLVLARDRIGEKPLCYAQAGGSLLFGSQLTALSRHPAWDGALDRDALRLYMRLGWIPAPHTIYAAARKLPPGHLLVVRGKTSQLKAYWSAAERAEALAGSFGGAAAAAAERLNMLLRASVSLRMRADVPVGVFLSGGVDSSVLAAITQDLAGTAVPTFTIGFEQAPPDDSLHARRVASHLGTDHHDIRISDDEALGLVPQLPEVWDEPFADPAQLPALLLARAARRRVTVALSGDGADELFGGHGTYRSIPRDWRHRQALPAKALVTAAARQLATLAGLAAGPVNLLGNLSGRGRRSYPGSRLHSNAENLAAGSLAEMLGLHYSRWRGMPDPVLGGGRAATVFDDPTRQPRLDDPALATMVLDALAYLPDDLCVKTDCATMAASLEARLPFLDPAIVELAWSLPTSLKIENDAGKTVMRDVARRYLPRELVERPKMGFEVPIGRWLTGRLRGWADDLLAEGRLKRQGHLNAPLIARCWQDHRSGARNRQAELWHTLMFQAWWDKTSS
jgi:asparagine synthase (glutamine-hydrolysing)